MLKSKNLPAKTSDINKPLPVGFRHINFRTLKDSYKVRILEKKIEVMDTPDFIDICQMFNHSIEDIQFEKDQLITYLNILKQDLSKPQKPKKKFTKPPLSLSVIKSTLTIQNTLFNTSLDSELERIYNQSLQFLKQLYNIDENQKQLSKTHRLIYQLRDILENDVKPLNDERKELSLKLRTNPQDTELRHRIEKIENYMIDYVSKIYHPLTKPLDKMITPLTNKIIAFFKVIDNINKKLKTLDFDFSEFYLDDGLDLIIKKKNTCPRYIIYDENEVLLKVPKGEYDTCKGIKFIIISPIRILNYSDLATTQKKQINALLKHILIKEFLLLREVIKK